MSEPAEQHESQDYVHALAASPCFVRDGICFVARSSGLYRSEDGGLTWEDAYRSLGLDTALAAAAVAVSPSFDLDRAVFAGVSGGILRSFDGGSTWTVFQLPAPPPFVVGLAISPDFCHDGVVLAATMEDGVFRSGDRGRSWAAWNFGLLDLNVLCLALSPAFGQDETAFAGTESSISRSTNGGRAWREVDFPTSLAPVLSLALSPQFAEDGTLFAGTESNGLFVSRDGGRTWACLGKGVIEGAVNSIVVGPAFPAQPAMLVLVGDALLASHDGGETWSDASLDLPMDRGLSAVVAPVGLDPGAPLLIGLADGEVRPASRGAQEPGPAVPPVLSTQRMPIPGTAARTRLIGLDIGTTGSKAVVFDAEGRLLARASREYAVDIPHPGWAEQDAERVWQLAQDAMRQAIAEAGPGEVVALGLSVQGEAVMPVDAQGHALRPAMLGMDTRTGEENAWLRERFGAEHLFARTGMVIHTVNTLPKLLWLKQHEPAVWAGADRFLLYEDFLIQKMTGQAVISRCLASRTQMYDILEDRWSPEILGAAELDPARLARVWPSGAGVGPMKRELAESLGLPEQPLVVTGGHDQACAALGVGLTHPGLAMDSTGTAEVVEVALASPVLNQMLYRGNVSVYAHTAPGLYLAMTLNHSGGISLRWFREALCQEEVRQAKASGEDAYDLILAGALPDPSPVFLMPHLAGSGTPWFDTRSRGAVLGMTLATTKTDLAKALLEGLTYELRINLDLLREGGVPIDEVRAAGGGARSGLWLQLKADITGLPVVVPSVTEAACWGAALLAGVGAGIFANAAQASESKLHLKRRFEPDPRRAALYEERYQLYREIYPALKGIQERM